ncbi:MAG: T9SS type A sorting domain-containing protein [Candidatus Neomarinimicrobiota bacterium]
MKNSKPEKILQLILMLSFIFGQDYKIQFSHIPIGQGFSLSDSLDVVNSIGGIVSRDASSDSFKIGVGFLNATQSILAEPPVISDFYFPLIIEKNGESVSITARIYDLNGIDNAELFLQIGGTTDEVILPMSKIRNSEYRAMIVDSLIEINNFRARIITTDNFSYSTTSEYGSTEIQFNNSDLTMGNESSFYPNGIEKGQWELISWPCRPKNNTLALSALEDGHVFYEWDPIKGSYFVASEIKSGRSYWFKHAYEDPVIIAEDTSFSIPLNDFQIDLEEGWNLISSPFSFPVQFKKDSMVSEPRTYGVNDKSSGWSLPQDTLYPWNGYAIYSSERASMFILPFSDDALVPRIAVTNEWNFSLKIETEDQINYASEIGRREGANEESDIFDIPIYPDIDTGIDVKMDINGNGNYSYMSDMRDIEETNGVWNLRLNWKGQSASIFGEYRHFTPDGITLALVDISKRKISYDFINRGVMINKDSDFSYDIKIVAGSSDYVERVSQDILNEIPEEFSLSQNYPNPFNPLTKLDYTLPQRSRVIISIYNVLGKEIVSLINDEQEYGYHSISWNGTDSQGRGVASGVYFAQMRSEGFNQSKKMLLLK